MRLCVLIAPVLLFTACNTGTLGVDSRDTGTADTGTADTGAADTGAADTSAADTGTTDTGGGDTGSTMCTAMVNSTSPTDNETNVAVNKVITARFSAAVGENDWSLSVEGVTGTSTLASNGLSATFEADAPLDTDTTYTLDASACGHDKSLEFTTADGPLPAESLSGNTYAIDYNDVTWVQPPNIGALVSSYVNIEYFLVNVEDVNTDAATIHAAASLGITDSTTSDIVQDPCTTPYDFGDQDFSGNPVFDVGPADFQAGNITLSSAEIKAAFVDGGASLQDIRISGQIDTAGANVGFDLCSFLSCTTCLENPSSDTCIDVLLVADQADKVDGLVFDPTLDPSLNSACN